METETVVTAPVVTTPTYEIEKDSRYTSVLNDRDEWAALGDRKTVADRLALLTKVEAQAAEIKNKRDAAARPARDPEVETFLNPYQEALRSELADIKTERAAEKAERVAERRVGAEKHLKYALKEGGYKLTDQQMAFVKAGVFGHLGEKTGDFDKGDYAGIDVAIGEMEKAGLLSHYKPVAEIKKQGYMDSITPETKKKNEALPLKQFTKDTAREFFKAM
jgi:hypothetical protein